MPSNRKEIKYIIIDDCKILASAIFDHLSVSFGNVIPRDEAIIGDFNTVKLSEKIIHNYEEEKELGIETVIIINANCLAPNRRRQDLEGVILLKRLRLLGFLGKIVVYSFERLHSILQRKPGSVAICAPGTYFLRLPFSFSQLDRILQEDFSGLNPMVNKRFFRGAFDWGEYRHSLANWWAIDNLLSVQENFTGKIERPSTVVEELEKLNNLVASKLFSHYNQTNINPDSSERGEIGELKEKIKERKPKILIIDDLFHEGWGLFYSYFFAGKPLPSRVEKENILVYGQIAVPKEIKPEVFSRIWAEGLLEELYPDFVLLDLRLGQQDNLYKNLDPIFLSGIRVLGFLRMVAPGLPIIITTSSNKVSTLQTALSRKADAFWGKEGIDDYARGSTSLRNYKKLVEIVEKITKDQYKIMIELSEKIREVKERKMKGKSFWWETFSWATTGIRNNCEDLDIPIQTECSFSTVIGLLEHSVSTFRSFLKGELLEYFYFPEGKNDWFIPSQVIQSFGKIIELIHDLETAEESTRDLSPTMIINRVRFKNQNNKWEIRLTRGDIWGDWLYGIRNRASHYKKAKHLDWTDLRKVIGVLFRYINTEPENKEYTMYPRHIGRLGRNRIVFDLPHKGSVIIMPRDDVFNKIRRGLMPEIQIRITRILDIDRAEYEGEVL